MRSCGLLTKKLNRMTREELELKAKDFDSKLKRHPMSSEELQNVLCDFVEALRIHDVSGISLLNQCLKEQEEIVNSPIRFNGIHINKLKQVFLKNGIDADELGF
jgi:hypothetical protein